MAVNLLNPGCGDDDCYPCDGCPQCTDYGTTWYIWADLFEQDLNTHPGYISYGSPPPYLTAEWYWSSSDLHTVLNNLLASFSWASPTIPAPGERSYLPASHPDFGSTTATGTIYTRYQTGPGPTWSSWVASNFTFRDFKFYYFEMSAPCDSTRSVAVGLECYADQTSGYPGSPVFHSQNQRVFFQSPTAAMQSCAVLPLPASENDLVLWAFAGGSLIVDNGAGYYYNVGIPLVIETSPPFVSPYDVFIGQFYVGPTAP